MTLLYDWLRAAAKAQGNNKALVYRDNYLSWRGLLHRVDRRAQEFKGMHLQKGAWVGLMLGNVPDFVILALALSKLRATIVPIDPTTGSRELELILAAAPLRALVTRPRGSEGGALPVPATTPAPTPAPTPQAGGKGGKAKTEAADTTEIRRRLQGTLLTCSVFKRSAPALAVDPAMVLFTSDSLGDPKGVVRTADNLKAAADNAIAALAVDEHSRVLCAVPLFHAYGWDVGLLPVLARGATLFLEEEISARRVAKILRDQTVDILPGTPGMYAELCRLPTAKPLKVKSPRFLSGGSRLDNQVASSFADKYGVKVMSCYHTTESAIVSIDHTTKAPTTVGKVIDGIQLRLTSREGDKVASGKQGVIWVKGASVASETVGPYEDIAPTTPRGKERTAVGQTDSRGWLRTGDVGKLDRSSRLTLAGREDDLVKVEGRRVALGEVEGCLESFPKVKHAQARVVSDPMAGSVVVAKVVAHAKCHAEEIIDHCARNLAPYKVPRRIEFCETI
jgi:long-chain acyl-CoA synthetase